MFNSTPVLELEKYIDIHLSVSVQKDHTNENSFINGQLVGEVGQFQ